MKKHVSNIRSKKRRKRDAKAATKSTGLWDIEEIALATQNDPCLQKLLQWTTLPTRDEISGESPELKFYWRVRENWKIDNNGLIWYKWMTDSSHYKWKLVIPKSLQEVVKKTVHDAPTGGHFGGK